jgi:hypothetical protein
VLACTGDDGGIADYAGILRSVAGSISLSFARRCWIAGITDAGSRDTGHRPHKPCYCETVKNITVSVPDDVYHDARVVAAQRDTSLSALVVAYLERLSGRMDELARLEALQQEVQAEIGQFRAADRLGRDEVHDRAVR